MTLPFHCLGRFAGDRSSVTNVRGLSEIVSAECEQLYCPPLLIPRVLSVHQYVAPPAALVTRHTLQIQGDFHIRLRVSLELWLNAYREMFQRRVSRVGNSGINSHADKVDVPGSAFLQLHSATLQPARQVELAITAIEMKV